MAEQDPNNARPLFRKNRASDVLGRMGRKRRGAAQGPEEAAPRTPASADYLAIKGRLQERLLEEIGERNLLAAGGETAVANSVEDFVERVLRDEDLAINDDERTRLSEELVEEALGLGPLAPLMADPAVTDILVNGPDSVYAERFGRLERTNVRFRDKEHITRIIERIAARVGRRIDQSWPMVDLRLPDGSRVNATIPPVSIDGPTISIRLFGRRRLRMEELVRLGTLSEDMATFLHMIVRARKNVIVSGGTGAGKSTLLGALAEAVPADERIVTIEDTAELILDQAHVVRMETRPPNVEGRGLISIRDLLVNSLRMRPSRIIVGEVRGGETLDMLQAMNTGHEGGMSTVHANSPRDAMTRLETMVLMAGTDLPSRAIREQITSAVHFLVHVRRSEDGVRRIDCISEITGMEGTTPLLQDIFVFRHKGRSGRRLLGDFLATGIVPRMVQELRDVDVETPLGIFKKLPEPGGLGQRFGATDG